MLKKLLVIYAILAMSFAFAIEEGKIQEVMNQRIKEITALLQDKNLQKSDKEQQIYAIIDTLFDYKTMSKISLGKRWKSLSSEQQERFSNKFEYKLKSSYFEKLELYTDQKVIVKELEKIKSNRIKVHSDIIGTDGTYEVIYKFYKAKESDDWLVYDVDITGVSIIQTYRKQFSEFLQNKSIDELIESL